MNNENFNAGCYSVADIIKKSKERELQREVNWLVLFLGLMLLAYFFLAIQGCGNWQVHFGVSEYNQNNEQRSFNDVKQKGKK